VLSHSTNNAIVLYGQRRIGKTSVLKELEAKLLQKGDYIPVFFDLQDKAQKTLGELLKELARKITDVLVKLNKANRNLGPPHLEPDPETAFHNTWLPNLLKKLPTKKSLVLLFDEFDVLDAPAAKQAGAAFFPYLQVNLLTLNTKRLNFVFVIGRRIDDLDKVALSVLKATEHKRVSLLNHEDTVTLIHLSQVNQTLNWSDEAIEKVWQLTSGHPYLTQVLCSLVWYKLRKNSPKEVIPNLTQVLCSLVWHKLRKNSPKEVIPTVTSGDIEEKIIEKAVETSEGALEWLWDGLPPAERVVASTLAEAGSQVITERQLEDILTQSGVKVVIRELQTAPDLLRKWDLIEGTAKAGYRFRVELLRRWIARHKPLNKVREELDKIEPVADLIYQTALRLYRMGKLEDALSKANEAVRLNPNHLAANQLLADILLTQNQPNEAREALERLYSYQPDATRPRLIQALLESAQASKVEDEQVKLYERVLELEVNHVEASRQLLAISLAKGQIKQASDLLSKLYEIQPNETMDWVENEPRRKDAIVLLLLLSKFANSEQNVQSVSGNGIVKKSLLEAMENKLSINQDLPTDIS